MKADAAMAQQVFEDEEAAKTWLRTANRAFRDVAPMAYLDTEPAAMSLRQVPERDRHGRSGMRLW